MERVRSPIGQKLESSMRSLIGIGEERRRRIMSLPVVAPPSRASFEYSLLQLETHIDATSNVDAMRFSNRNSRQEFPWREGSDYGFNYGYGFSYGFGSIARWRTLFVPSERGGQ